MSNTTGLTYVLQRFGRSRRGPKRTYQVSFSVVENYCIQLDASSPEAAKDLARKLWSREPQRFQLVEGERFFEPWADIADTQSTEPSGP